jgi:hypothetical protein
MRKQLRRNLTQPLKALLSASKVHRALDATKAAEEVSESVEGFVEVAEMSEIVTDKTPSGRICDQKESHPVVQIYSKTG